MLNYIKAVDNGCLLFVYLQPGATRNAIVGEYNGRLKIALQAPPIEGKANAALVAFLVDKLKLSKSQIELVKGFNSRQKVVHIYGLKPAELLSQL